jgi:hypothetical protein
MRFEFWRATPIPLTLRVIHTLQLLASIPALPLLPIFLLLFVVNFRDGFVFLLPLPWLLSAFTNFLLLHFERVDSRIGKMSETRYSKIQMLKLIWSIIFFTPLMITSIFGSTGMKLTMMILLLHPSGPCQVIACNTVIHW